MFSERLKQLRKENNLKQSDLAKVLGISTQRISLYENGREPEYDILIKMSDYFGVLVDFLIGKSKYRTIQEAMHDQEITDYLDSPITMFSLRIDVTDDRKYVTISDETQTIGTVTNEDYQKIEEHFEPLIKLLIEKCSIKNKKILGRSATSEDTENNLTPKA